MFNILDLQDIMAWTPNEVCPSDLLILNLTDSPYTEFYLYSRGETILITIVMPIIWVIGVLANVAFIFVVCRLRRMSTVTNYYLVNLAIADIMFLCFAEGDKIGRYLASPVYDDQHGLKAVGCAMLNYFVQLSYYGSIFLVTLVTLEKYYAVCRPVLHRLVTGTSRTIRLVTLAWICAGVFALCLIPGWVNWQEYCIIWPDEDKYVGMPNLTGYCQPVSEAMRIVGNGLQTIPFFIVMVLNFVMYALIIRAVNTRVAVREQQQGMAAVRSIQMRNQVVRMLIINGVIFFVCLSPYQFSSFAMMISGAIGKYLLDDNQAIQVIWAGRILSYINSACNPFVYTMTNPRYRSAFAEAFACCPMVKKRLRVKAKLDEATTQTTSADHKESAIDDKPKVIKPSDDSTTV
ncbi:neuropeptides capa receptor-like [Diadema antillarum]|uniref:neuropeptides capa receptor-like n=1 Tax=Diadema antillarum TaxID=105358 RepID=UPI003A8909C0